MSNSHYELFRDLFADKLRQTKTSREMLDIVRAAEEAVPHLPGEEEEKMGFAFSYANYEDAVVDCRKIKSMNFKNVERIEMMIGVRELPYPFTCIVETSATKMHGLDEEFVAANPQLRLRNDEIGSRNIAQLIYERQSLLHRNTWETDPPLMGFES